MTAAARDADSLNYHSTTLASRAAVNQENRIRQVRVILPRM